MSHSFIILDTIFDFTDQDDLYYDDCKEFQVAAFIAEKKIEKEYRRLGDLDRVISSIERYGWQLIEDEIKVAVDKAIQRGHYDLDTTTFDYDEKIREKWDDVIENVTDLYHEIAGNAASNAYDRERARENRERTVGGGFGLAGAVAGTVAAVGVDLVTGLLQGAFNSVANAVDRYNEYNLKADAYESDEILDLLRDGIKSCITDIPITLHCYHYGWVPSSFMGDRETAKRLLQNVESKKIPNEAMPNVILTIFANAFASYIPYKLDLKEYLSEEELKTVDRMKEYFDINYEVSEPMAYAKMYRIKDNDEVIKQALKGDPASQYRMYEILEKRDEFEAKSWLVKSAKNEYPQAVIKCVEILIERDTLEDAKTAIKILKDHEDMPEVAELLERLKLENPSLCEY